MKMYYCVRDSLDRTTKYVGQKMEGATGCSVVAEGCEVCCGITRRKSNLEGERRSETGGVRRRTARIRTLEGAMVAWEGSAGLATQCFEEARGRRLDSTGSAGIPRERGRERDRGGAHTRLGRSGTTRLDTTQDERRGEEQKGNGGRGGRAIKSCGRGSWRRMKMVACV